VEAESYRNLLNANQFEWTYFTAIDVQAQLNRFASALHEGVEVFCLGVAAPQAGDCGDVVAFLVPFDDDGEFARTLHTPILA